MSQYEKKVYKAVFYNIMEYSRNDYMHNYEFVDKLARGRIVRLRQCLSYTYSLKTAIDNYEEKIVDDSILEDIVLNYVMFLKSLQN